eukprot:47752-Prymnesium_polylepis.1
MIHHILEGAIRVRADAWRRAGVANDCGEAGDAARTVACGGGGESPSMVGDAKHHLEKVAIVVQGLFERRDLSIGILRYAQEPPPQLPHNERHRDVEQEFDSGSTNKHRWHLMPAINCRHHLLKSQ